MDEDIARFIIQGIGRLTANGNRNFIFQDAGNFVIRNIKKVSALDFSLKREAILLLRDGRVDC